MGIIETKDFGVRYGEKVIFSDANIDIPAGRFFAILGYFLRFKNEVVYKY